MLAVVTSIFTVSLEGKMLQVHSNGDNHIQNVHMSYVS